jgi:hypothetical protein
MNKTIKNLIPFFIGNALVFVGFSALWAWEYRVEGDLSDKIDHVVVPWLWLLGFFVVSISTLNKTLLKTTLISLSCAIGFSLILLIFVKTVVTFFFDPWL